MTLESEGIVSIRGWWWFLIKATFFVVTGIAILSGPVETYLGSRILAGLGILGIGISQLLFALINRNMAGWGWTFASGLIDLAAGSCLLLYPFITLATLPFFVGFWLLFRASYFIGVSLDLQAYQASGWGWLFAGGGVLMALSGIILYFPADAASAIVGLSGSAFLIGSALSLVIAIKFRGFDK